MESERLIIKNFLSIKEFDWEIKDFNILTGDMGSGKSLCFKLLYFFQTILIEIFNIQNLTKEDIDYKKIKDRMTEVFYGIFFIKNSNVNLTDTSVIYSYKLNDVEFKLSAVWGSRENNLDWNCEYIENNIDNWKSINVGNEAGSSSELRRSIFEAILHDFGNKFPMGVTYIPASRAILSLFRETPNFSSIRDPFVKKLFDLSVFFKVNFNDGFNDDVKKILHINNVKIDSNDEKPIFVELLERRNIPLSYASSGQQELFYLLWIAEHIQDYNYFSTSKDNSSLFLEEPSTHLFPQEQKETIEYIVRIFQRNSEKKKVKFFISTHSPYVLDIMNNMLYKGNLIRRFSAAEERINNEIPIPFIHHDDVSAFFIEGDGTVTNMVRESDGDFHLYEDKILEISAKINDDTNNLHYLNNILIKETDN